MTLDAQRVPWHVQGADGRNGTLMTLVGSAEVKVIRDEGELESIHTEWMRVQGQRITADPEYFAAGLRADPLIERPHVVVLERGGTVVGMLVGRVETLRPPVKFGYRTVFAPRLKSITVVYGGILGDLDEESFAILLASLRESLAGGEADVVTFRFVPIDSPYRRIISSSAGFLGRQYNSPVEMHWELELPEVFDDFLGSLSKKRRQNLVQQARKIEREFGDDLDVRVYRDPSELDEFFRDIETVAPKTYQHAIGVAFGDTSAHRERTRVCMERGWFRGYVLRLAGQPVAYKYGDLYRGCFRGGRPGYDSDFAHYRVGTFLSMRVLADLCQDEHAESYDYGIGDGEHKRAFSSRSRRESNIVLYAPTLRARTINLGQTVLFGAQVACKRVLGRGKLFHNLKRWSRKRVQAR